MPHLTDTQGNERTTTVTLTLRGGGVNIEML